jgi:hypothetical protein
VLIAEDLLRQPGVAGCVPESRRQTSEQARVEGVMQDQSADEFFDLARTASSPFMRAYLQRVAVGYLSTEGELRAFKSHDVATSEPTG